MENPNCENGNGGATRIPIGFKFMPTDGELVVHYLRKKVLSLPLPTLNPIFELDVFQSNPWDLPGDLKDKRYFFTEIKREGVNKCVEKLCTCCGHWKDIGKDKPVVAHGTNTVVAIRQSFVFYKDKSTKMQWIMHLYRLVGYVRTPNNLSQKLMMLVGDWAVCGLYQSKRKPKKGVELANFRKPVITDISSAQDSPTSPCSSEITYSSSYSE